MCIVFLSPDTLFVSDFSFWTTDIFHELVLYNALLLKILVSAYDQEDHCIISESWLIWLKLIRFHVEPVYFEFLKHLMHELYSCLDSARWMDATLIFGH